MNPRIQIIAIIGSVAVILFIFELIRRRKLREEYSFLWFGAGIGLLILSFWRDLLEILARLTGVAYPPSVLLLGGILLGFFLAVHYSISLSRLAEQNKRLAQEIAFLRHHLSTTTTTTHSPQAGDRESDRPDPTGSQKHEHGQSLAVSSLSSPRREAL